MVSWDPREGEEPFITSSTQFPDGKYPAPDAPGGIREIGAREAAKTDAREEAADMRLQHHGLRYEAKQEAGRFKTAMADRKAGRTKGKTGDPITDTADDLYSFQRREAFALGVAEVAHRLGSIAQNQGDLFAASVRRYPQQSSGSGGGQWRPQRGVRERNIG